MVRWLIAIFTALAALPAAAQFGVPWARTPAITIVANGDDPRIALVETSVKHWNAIFEALGSGFRLGNVERVDRPIPEGALQSLSASIVGGVGGSRPWIAASLTEVRGDLIVYLAHSEFVSFAGPFDSEARRVVGIRGPTFAPMPLPNVALNVIAHELGHAIGLGHNADPTQLMCGRPAPCRPGEFRSSTPRIFPLTDDERRALLGMYPPGWVPR